MKDYADKLGWFVTNFPNEDAAPPSFWTPACCCDGLIVGFWSFKALERGNAMLDYPDVVIKYTVTGDGDAFVDTIQEVHISWPATGGGALLGKFIMDVLEKCHVSDKPHPTPEDWEEWFFNGEPEWVEGYQADVSDAAIAIGLGGTIKIPAVPLLGSIKPR